MTGFSLFENKWNENGIKHDLLGLHAVKYTLNTDTIHHHVAKSISIKRTNIGKIAGHCPHLGAVTER